jgi:hypothetical protein
MEKRIHVVFSAITPDEWKAFRLACVQNGETMTKVLMRAIRDYILYTRGMEDADNGK